MELKDFVRQSLLDIVAAVREAGAELAGQGALINPNARIYAEAVHPQFMREVDIQNVDFEVAVTAEDKTGVDGKASIKVLSFEVGGGGSHQAVVGTVSKLRFSVPLSLPHNGKARE